MAKENAATLNEMRLNCHQLMTMYLAKKHNESTDKGEAVYINRYAKKRPASRVYECNK